jgi:hypothetical protein
MMKAAKLPPGPKTPLELALHEMKSLDSLENPREAKYRRLRLTNAKIAAAVVDTPGMPRVMAELGWVPEEGNADFLVLPESVQLTMVHVRAMDAQKAALEAQMKANAKARLQARNAKLDPEKERLRQQLEADKRERAATAPVTEGSVAQRTSFGANVTTAGDLGINGGGGG